MDHLCIEMIKRFWTMNHSLFAREKLEKLHNDQSWTEQYVFRLHCYYQVRTEGQATKAVNALWTQVNFTLVVIH